MPGWPTGEARADPVAHVQPPRAGDLIIAVRPTSTVGWTAVDGQPETYWRHATGDEAPWPPSFPYAVMRPLPGEEREGQDDLPQAEDHPTDRRP